MALFHTRVCVLSILLFPCVMGISTYYMDTRCIGMSNKIVLSPYGMSTMRLRLTQRSTYHADMNCVLFVNTDPGSRIMFHFKYLDIETTASCSEDWLELRDGNSTTSPYIPGIYSRVCGSAYSSYGYSTTNNAMTFLFVSGKYWGERGFEMILTTYHTGSCNAGEFECSNGRCIDDHITCNGYNPCNDHSDCPLSGGAVAGIVIGCFFFVVIVATVIIILRGRRRRQRSTYTHVNVTPSANQPPGYGTAGGGYNQPAAYPYPQGQQYPPS